MDGLRLLHTRSADGNRDGLSLSKGRTGREKLEAPTLEFAREERAGLAPSSEVSFDHYGDDNGR